MRRRRLVWVAEHTTLVALGALAVAPVVFVVFTSLMSSRQALTANFVPDHWVWANYRDVFSTVPLGRWFANSALYAVLATLFMLL